MRETNKIQILAVDDVAANLNVLRLPLEKAGYRFTVRDLPACVDRYDMAGIQDLYKKMTREE